MKLLKITLVLAASALLLAQADTALQKGIRKETVEGDLKGAIDQFKKLAQDKNHAIAAQALIHLGECYEKLGSTEARAQYELVISKFPDQKDAVAQAQAHLGGAAVKASGMVNRPVWESLSMAITGDTLPSVSPDGRYICYPNISLEELKDGVNLWLHDLTNATDRRLTTGSKGDGVLGCAFSSDSKLIAYSFGNKQGDELRILSLSGTASAVPRVLMKNADIAYGQPAWSPDGKSIAVSLYLKDRKTRQLILASVQDGSFRVLSSSGDPDNLAFSPDGKYLAFNRSTGGGKDRDVFVLAMDGGREIPVVENPGLDLAIGWSPDGKHLLFASDRGGSLGLYARTFEDGKPQGPSALIKADIGVPIGLTASGAFYYQARSHRANRQTGWTSSGSTSSPRRLPRLRPKHLS